MLSFFLPDEPSETPKALALWPAATIEGAHNEVLDRLTDSPGPYSRGGLFRQVVDEARISRDEVSAATRIVTEKGFLIFFQCRDVQKILSRLARRGYQPTPSGKFSIYQSAGAATSLAFTDLGENTLGAGSPTEVKEAARLAAGESPSLYASRKDLRPILNRLSQDPAFGVILQRQANRGPVKGAEIAVTGTGMVLPPFVALLSIQAIGEAYKPLEGGGCRQNLAFQYGNSLAAATVATVFRALSVLGALEMDSAMDSPDDMDVDRSGGFVDTTMTFSKKKCDEAVEKQRSRNFKW
ncbi:MAG TPA: hypothetical protein VN851_19045 [Thermoanaerobaculia bacterium]|nr:hypothetical protein [Thermoanaerobaculia bacterium]